MLCFLHRWSNLHLQLEIQSMKETSYHCVLAKTLDGRQIYGKKLVYNHLAGSTSSLIMVSVLQSVFPTPVPSTAFGANYHNETILHFSQ